MSAEKVRQEGLDKFYTLPSVAKECLRLVELKYPWDYWVLIIEPSAGNGSFFLQIPSSKKIGLDIAPEHSSLQKQNFLHFFPDNLRKILVVGNPPFGKNSSLALQFFNHSAQFASVIAFIIPRTFRRISLQNKLNPYFHLIHDSDIPTEPCAFDPPMMAKCCFQIWEKRTIERTLIPLPTSHADWQFLEYGPLDSSNQPTPPPNADFALRAYGGKCGEIVQGNLRSLRPKSWHWIRSNLNKDELIRRFQSLDYSISKDTARQNSLGRGDLVRLYHEKYNN